MAICPHCEQGIDEVDTEAIPLSDEALRSSRGLLYSCPNCERILSVGFDPVALEKEVVKAVVEALLSTPELSRSVVLTPGSEALNPLGAHSAQPAEKRLHELRMPIVGTLR